MSWVAWQLGREPDGALCRRLGPLVPLPMTLRELRLDEATTWGSLLDQFLSRPLARRLSSVRVKDLLARGQAFVLLDGIDEIGSTAVREALRAAARDGAATYRSARWLLTSRAVGYDAVPFHRTTAAAARRFEAEVASPEPREHEAAWAGLSWLAPFDDGRIERYARIWYARHEAPREEAERRADDLIGAVRLHPDARALARTPVFLTLMALIHRIQARLPHGRALLYSKIVEAYLESIDRFRGIEEVGFSLEEKRRWLGEVGFRMQRRRGETAKGAKTASQEILVTDGELVGWLAEAMALSPLAFRSPSDLEATARTFVGYVARRSGLLLPRGVDEEGRDLYAFTHLSFQEFFAALYLHGRMRSPRWLERKTNPMGDGPEDLRRYADQAEWQETLAFLFGLLAGEREWAEELAELLFGERLGGLFEEGRPTRPAATVLLARVSVDPHAGLPGPLRREAWKIGWRWHLRSQPDRWEEIEFRLHDHPVAAALLSAGEHDAYDVLGCLAEAWEEEHATVLSLRSAVAFKDLQPILDLPRLRGLNLDGTALAGLDGLERCKTLEALFLGGTHIRDLTPLSKLENLGSLSLDRTQVRDLTPLATLQALQRLYLSGTHAQDLSPLAQLQNLKILLLSGTRVHDLSPLAKLPNLFLLGLDGTEVKDLPPLTRLWNLQYLNLSDTQVHDLSPLTELRNLEYLHLSGTQVHDLSPLAKLRNLLELDLSGTQVHDLSPLAHLEDLGFLDLSSTRVQDLCPLAKLRLQSLYVSGTQVHDLSPLAELQNLERLGLDGTKVNDLSVLAKLQNLQYLNLSGTRVQDLSPLAKLEHLEEVHLAGTRVDDLSPLLGKPNLHLVSDPRNSQEARRLAAALG